MQNGAEVRDNVRKLVAELLQVVIYTKREYQTIHAFNAA